VEASRWKGVSSRDTRTEALGIVAPLASRTVPRKVPVLRVWPQAAAAARKQSAQILWVMTLPLGEYCTAAIPAKRRPLAPDERFRYPAANAPFRSGSPSSCPLC